MDYSMMESVSYSYDEPGIYKGYLRVSANDLDLSGFTMYDWAYFTIVVSEPGAPLGANADGNGLGGYEGSVETPVTFYGIATGGVPSYTFEWDINGHTLTGQTVEYTFNAAGTYTVELTVTDSEFNTATDTTTVYIAGLDELVAKAGGPYDTIASEPVYLTGGALGGKAPYTYTWDFGDGTTPVTAQNPIHVYETEGSYTVTLTVTDSVGTVDEATTTVTVSSEHDEPEIINVKGGLSIKATVVAADLPVDWTITIDGEHVFGRTTATGSVAPNAQETIRAPYVFGLGNVDITIQANDVVSQHTAFMLGPFVLSLS
jgi:PKD repeat protein